MKAVVVGAGLAGLAAADELSRRGIEPVVLEARERVGGRVHSRVLDNGGVVEMGAEFILPGCTAVLALADRFGLALWDKGMRYGAREPRGIEVTKAALEEAAARIDRELGDAPARESARALLERIEIDAGAREAILARVEVSAAASADLVPAAELGGLARLSDEPAPGIAGGNGRLAGALADSLSGRVHLDDPARSIAWDEDGVSVRTDAGAITARGCIVAVPATVIDGIDFDPPLPAQKAEALGRIDYGHAAKLFVPLLSAAPPSATLAVPERFWAWTATGEGERPLPLVTSFAGSPAALERLEADRGAERWLERLAALRPDLALDPAGALISTWDDDPWVAAAYSLEPDAGVLEAAAAPVGPLAFAGEHLAGEYGALMEGALRSGLRAAEEIATGKT